ncbi:hypothetical protein [Parvicella tangerina]|uniref:Uncharacterized protein n=1 Tax=Parvicella tangerina TaxID=2829795 RepID=A0A916NAG7_9FLAO|nr:hypothetical protein [Parvicella tangerina]CAG5080663.1 hypothetical protein CRYO30217_01412 [Parvicella tangerina]
MRLILFVSLIVTCLSTLAQNKFEKEYKISAEKVPVKALGFTKQLISSTDAIKWYREESQDGTTLEAKLDRKGLLLSVEFDTTGQLIDLEILVDHKDLPDSISNEILHELDSSFQKYKIVKIQLQYSGLESDVLEVIKGSSDETAITVKYEVVVRAKADKSWQWYETTHDRNGTMIEKLIIVRNNTDHLEY